MKSFSDELPNSDKIVTPEQLRVVVADHNKVVDRLQLVINRHLMLMCGLAAFNLIVTVVLFIVFHH